LQNCQRWKGDGAILALVRTVAASHNASKGLEHFRRAGFLVPAVHPVAAELEAFSTTCAFRRINAGIPRDLFPRRPFPRAIVPHTSCPCDELLELLNRRILALEHHFAIDDQGRRRHDTPLDDLLNVSDLLHVCLDGRMG
jgi:hypothetical protein